MRFSQKFNQTAAVPNSAIDGAGARQVKGARCRLIETLPAVESRIEISTKNTGLIGLVRGPRFHSDHQSNEANNVLCESGYVFS